MRGKKEYFREIRGLANIYWSGLIMQMSIYAYCSFACMKIVLSICIEYSSVIITSPKTLIEEGRLGVLSQG